MDTLGKNLIFKRKEMDRILMAYILVNNARVVEVSVLHTTGNLYTVKFKDRNTVIRIPKHRLYQSEEEAFAAIPEKFKGIEQQPSYRPPDMH